MSWTEISLPETSSSERLDLMQTLRNDSGLLAGTVVWHDPGGLVNSGRTQYFYHEPGSNLPIRDVNGWQGQGSKTEPHVECGGGIIAENLVKNCCQSNIKSGAMKGERYLFLVTRPSGYGSFYSEKFIVGYIANRGFGVKSEGGIFVFGDGHLVRFEDAVPMSALGLGHVRRGIVRIGEDDAAYLVAKFVDAENVLHLCAEEVVESIEERAIHCPDGDNCFFRDSCLSYGEI